ncbi:transglutaminase superfamily protein [Flavobacterium sp. 90]|uniref:transglutaminase-like domain-containing protein n=1 Tax=unclassified Flavobacterium TaxID=196869 RepID=UPI000F29F813|nr:MULTISPECIES: transglutaminase-like domain-containing protein [unclassified Flavobacterium]RKR08695.1 transglutaminase superfamily protein [Flavobacterium sp. 81]TCK52482.1 transglutaminase superfamily protein [Flavobacterium sp. 90]
MKIKISLVAIFAIFSQTITSQKSIPTIKAMSSKLDIRDGKSFKPQYWTISPQINPDVYETSSLGQKVTFITDKDSISVKIKKDTKLDFIILLNDSTKAYTQIKYKAVPQYLEILKNAEKYNYSDNRFIPNFSYQSIENPNLVKIRKDLKLDSIAGTGNEISKILNLLHWVHNTIRHDGASNNPTSRNAIDLIKVCKTENRGINCRMMATILNECYLSLGIKSRYITCMPKETQFDDCHVINMVYSNEFKKWIWIDPTFNAYVMNEKGELLSIAEVRERLIKGKTLILNPEANWNNQASQTKKYYLETYMAKNLYRLQTPLISQYDSETWKNVKEITYVELLPLDGIEQTPQKSELTNNETKVNFTYYKTNNPNLFWTKPTE